MTATAPWFVSRAQQLFLRPKRTYPWDDIVRGARVLDRRGRTRTIPAVGSNTFRAFHRINKRAQGPQASFVQFFLSQKATLLSGLQKIDKCSDLHSLSNAMKADLVARLGNIRPDQLTSYNKVRKLVDLYLEHLVSMADELAPLRSQLVPLLFLPLDSWILQCGHVFSPAELKAHDLKPTDSFGAIRDEVTYLSLQRLATGKARQHTTKLGARFHPIYFDLFWNNRYKNWGENLFETVCSAPGRTRGKTSWWLRDVDDLHGWEAARQRRDRRN